MQTIFDVVDLLQLQEVWVRLPITQAFSRLERRHNWLSGPMDFSVRWLMPRLGQVRKVTGWHSSESVDPGKTPLCALTDPHLAVLYPDFESPALAREQLFLSAYNHFVVTRYQGDSEQTCDTLAALAETRMATDCLTAMGIPIEGSNFWIPVDLTDEIRALDTRYDSSLPDTPATFVVAEDFWTLLVKASADDVNAAAARACAADATCRDACVGRLGRLIDLAREWNRSSSVVGLYYQVNG